MTANRAFDGSTTEAKEPTVYVLEHHRAETSGIIADALALSDISTEYVRAYTGAPVPAQLGEAAGLVVMGGPMGVNDEAAHPYLAAERRLIEQALAQQKPVLGICLGSQLLASVLGAPVAPGPRKEIGWYEVTLTADAPADPLWQGMPDRFTAFHWHGDAYPPPSGAVTLASSELTPCQAFRYGPNAYGFLFHMEVTEPMVRDMAGHFGDEVKQAGGDGHAIVAGIEEYLPALHAIGDAVFARWAALVRG